jgi:hypothetical protein
LARDKVDIGKTTCIIAHVPAFNIKTIFSRLIQIDIFCVRYR